MSLATPAKLRRLQRALYATAKRDPVPGRAPLLDAYRKVKATGSFILIDPEAGGTAGAGMVIDRAPEDSGGPPAGALPRSRHIRREPSAVGREERERRLGQRGVTVWLTGLPGAGKSSIAREAERVLHERGRQVYVLDGDTLRFGLNRDLAFGRADRAENLRRTAEVARLLNEAGFIVQIGRASCRERV